MITMCSPAELRKLPNDDELEVSLKNETEERQAKLRRKMQLRHKIKAVGRLNLLLGKLRENAEEVIK